MSLNTELHKEMQHMKYCCYHVSMCIRILMKQGIYFLIFYKTTGANTPNQYALEEQLILEKRGFNPKDKSTAGL